MASAGWGKLVGDERELWTDGHFNVVLGNITQIKHNVTDSSRYDAKFKPSVTIAGRFDCSNVLEFSVTFFITPPGSGWVTSAITDIPSDGAMVMVVMEFTPRGKGVPNDSGSIASQICEFMPHSSALVVVSGIEDPEIANTLLQIRRARFGQWIEQPTTRQVTTKPVKDTIKKGGNKTGE